jgi:hypothetical protein
MPLKLGESRDGREGSEGKPAFQSSRGKNQIILRRLRVLRATRFSFSPHRSGSDHEKMPRTELSRRNATRSCNFLAESAKSGVVLNPQFSIPSRRP